MLIDSHCHLNMLDLKNHPGGLDEVVQQARDEGVEHILCVGVDLPTTGDVLQVAEKYTDVSASVGLHPSEQSDYDITKDELLKLANHPKVVALGETGLDYHYNEKGLDKMRERFRTHIQAANEISKPIIIHSRAAQEDTLMIMREEGADQCGGVMHCFTESWEMATAALELGFYISISGIVTFKNAQQVVDVATKVPLDRLLIETDAPYLTPVPFRGKPNQPKYVRYVAEKIAELKSLSVEEVAKQTTENFRKLFKVA